MKNISIITKSITAVLLLFAITFPVLGQVQQSPPPPSLPNIIPPSPTVANLMQFEEVPVDNYSGQPDIAIPLLTKSLGGGLSLPLALKYNTQGVKIHNRSGWTGTGWSLEAGGVVSRTVRGIPDERRRGLGDSIDTGVYHLPLYWNYHETGIGSPSDSLKNEFAWHVNGTNHNKFDCELDLYQFSVLGLSGRFVLVLENGVLVPKLLDSGQKLKIEVSYHPFHYDISSFTITDPMGNKYLFSKKETTKSKVTSIIFPQYPTLIAPNTPTLQDQGHVSAWHLTTIMSSVNQTLATFNYIEDASPGTTNPKRKEHYDEAPNVTTADIEFQHSINAQYMAHPYNKGQFKPKKSISLYSIKNTTQKLQSISFADNTQVTFQTSAAGSHPENHGVYLTGLTYSDNQTIQHYEMEYEIVGSRLWLMKVSENGLEHNLDYFAKHTLPGFYTGDIPSETDAWGYNESLIWNSTHQYQTYNPLAHRIGLLSSISYPTGGVKQSSQLV